MTPERSCARPYTRYTVVLQWHIVAFPWARQSQCLSVLLFSRSQLQRSRGQHANWCCGTASVEASRPQAGVYSQPPSPVSPLTSSLLNSPSLSLPEVQAGYYPCVWGKLCAVRDEWGERGLCGAKERKRELPCSPQTSSVSLLYLSLMTACVNRGQQRWPLAPCHTRDQKLKQRSTKLS